MTAHISHQIQQAEQQNASQRRYLWYTNPDFNYGYNYTPTNFVPVADDDLNAVMIDVINQVKHGRNTYRQLVTALRQEA